jgi:hypothetical protein
VVLISSSFLLVVIGAVAVGQFYWESLHGGMQRMRASIDEARRRQSALAQDLQRSQAVLAARRAELDRREAELNARERALRAGGGDGTEPSPAAADPRMPGPVQNEVIEGPPGAPLSALQRRHLQSLLAALARSASRLPLPPPGADGRGPYSTGRGAPRSGRYGPEARSLIKGQIRLAETALMLGDPLLLDAAAAAAQRLLIDLYGEGQGRARALGEQLGLVRLILRGETGGEALNTPFHPTLRSDRAK